MKKIAAFGAVVVILMGIKNFHVICNDISDVKINISSVLDEFHSSNYDNCNLKKTTIPVITDNDITYSLKDNSIILNDDIKKILIDGDEAFKEILKIKVDGNSYINISGKSYARVLNNMSNYDSLYEYLNKKYNLRDYYTDDFIRRMISYVFRDVDGKCYMLYGNPEPAVIVKDLQIVSRKDYNNKIYVVIKDNCSSSKNGIYAHAVLIYNGNKWLIDKFDNWGIK